MKELNEKKEFNERFKELRKSKGLTQHECAELFDASWITVWRWENEEPPKDHVQIGLLETLEQYEGKK